MKKRDNKYHYKLKKSYKKKQLVLAMILIACFISIIIVFGRYITNNINNFFVRTKEFYFYSDKLGETKTNYQIDNWSGVDDYVITINMNSNQNNLNSATYDITYNISYQCTDNVICQLSKTQGNISKEQNSDFFNLTITPNTQLKTGDKVIIDIEVDSTAKYTKKLSGRFILVVGKENLTYQITDSQNSAYMELRLTNTLSYYIVKEAFDTYSVGDRINDETYKSLTDENKNKCYSGIVTLNFDPQKILLDLTSEVYKNASNIQYQTINGINYVNSITINLDAISSENLRFYKVDASQDYSYPNSNNNSVVEVTST